uniref:C2H2-type domain-containing protein n=1 Tax=Steinernema glaseri TaxID=37863 RepID=A0A1I8ANY0_9BILA
MSSPSLESTYSRADITCDLCSKTYCSVSSLNKHKREQHNLREHFARPPSIRCGDPSCSRMFTQMTDLCQHVHGDHHRDDVLLEEARFPNFDRFDEWRKSVEVDTMSKFTKLCGSGKRGGRQRTQPHFYYQCHLSGYVGRMQQKESAGLRRRTSKKMDRHCTAFMKVRVDQNTGRVAVTACLTHFGHETDIEQLPISEDLKSEIVQLLRAGLTDTEIVNQLREGATPNDRAFYLKRYEVRNILTKLNRSGGVLELKSAVEQMSPGTLEAQMEARKERLVDTIGGLLHTIQCTTDPEWLRNVEDEMHHFMERIHETAEEEDVSEGDIDVEGPRPDIIMPTSSRSGRFIKIRKLQ